MPSSNDPDAPPDGPTDPQREARDARERPPSEAKKELSQLWQHALGQIDEIRDAIVRGSQAGRAKLDEQLLLRQKDRLLAQLGALLLEEVDRGAALPPACADLARRIQEVQADIEKAETEAKRALKR
jgi:hypothetical protein